MAAFQAEVLDKPGSDCHTKKTIDVVITEKNMANYRYRYIVGSSGNYIRLDPDVIQKYIGKKVKMRSPIYCKKPICNICAGDMNYKLGNINIGLGCSKIGTTMQKMGMKKFHISTMSSKMIDVDDMLL